MSKDAIRKELQNKRGLCRQCGKPAMVKNGKVLTLCENCLAKQRAYITARQARLRNLGKCPYCGKSIESGEAQCEDCRAKRRASYPKYAKTHKEREQLQKIENADDTDGVRLKVKDLYYDGEEKYADFAPTEDDLNSLGKDSKKNIDRCLMCEIPVKYCTGEECITAYRIWKYVEELKGKK